MLIAFLLSGAFCAHLISARQEASHCTDGSSMLQVLGKSRGSSLSGQKVEANPQTYMKLLLKSQTGEPNPRTACTSGNFEARQVIMTELAALGLQPLGTNGSFEWVVNGTAIPGCEHGIANVIGYVKGTEQAEEFLMWVAHVDGPNNQGPSRATGNGITDNAYDDATSVAVGLSLANVLSETPPRRSVIFFFSGGEEGWDNVGISVPGQPLSDVAKTLCSSGLVPHPNGTNPCKNYPIGFTAWAQQPTVELHKLRLLLDADPLGAPGVAGSDFLSLLGAESTPGLQGVLESKWPAFPEAVTPFWGNRNYASTNYNDVDAVTKRYTCVTSNKPCLADGGVPFVWLAQVGFQRYHGGLMIQVLSILEQLGKYLRADFASLTAYYALDERSATSSEVLDRAFATLSPLLLTLANDTSLDLQFDRTVYEGTAKFTLTDARNNKADVDYLSAALSKGPGITFIPADATKAFKRLLWAMSLHLGIIDAYYSYNPLYWGKDPRDIYPGLFFQETAPLIFAVTIGIDFYSEANPNRQRYEKPVNLRTSSSLEGVFEELKNLQWH